MIFQFLPYFILSFKVKCCVFFGCCFSPKLSGNALVSSYFSAPVVNLSTNFLNFSLPRILQNASRDFFVGWRHSASLLVHNFANPLRSCFINTLSVLSAYFFSTSIISKHSNGQLSNCSYNYWIPISSKSE